MPLFKKKKTLSPGQLKIQELSVKPYHQLATLQKRLDRLQASHLQLDTHIGELKLNADGEILRIQMLMDKIKNEMADVKEHITHFSENLGSLVGALNLTSKVDELERFKTDLERYHPFNFVTIKQFEKLVKDELEKH